MSVEKISSARQYQAGPNIIKASEASALRGGYCYVPCHPHIRTSDQSSALTSSDHPIIRSSAYPTYHPHIRYAASDICCLIGSAIPNGYLSDASEDHSRPCGYLGRLPRHKDHIWKYHMLILSPTCSSYMFHLYHSHQIMPSVLRLYIIALVLVCTSV